MSDVYCYFCFMNKKEAANYMIIRVKGIEVLLAQKSNVYKIVVDGKIVVR